VLQIKRNGGSARQPLCAQALKLFILQQGDACNLPISAPKLLHHVSCLEELIIMVFSWHLQNLGGF
jgi:hypothetical protein